MLGGDFNQIIHPSEHSSTEVDHLTASMVELRDCFHHMSLYDLRYHGSHFTWSNKQPDSPITKKLDRLLINSQILNLFPNCTASFLPSLTSDHCPCLVDLAYKTPSHGTRPFKFYNYLAKHPSFHQVVLEAWTQAGSTAWNLSALCVCFKLCRCKQCNPQVLSFLNWKKKCLNAGISSSGSYKHGSTTIPSHPSSSPLASSYQIHSTCLRMRFNTLPASLGLALLL